MIFTFKNTNSKHQIPNKSQIQIFNDQNLQDDIVWIFKFRLLGFVWHLGFDIWDFSKSINIQQSKSLPR